MVQRNGAPPLQPGYDYDHGDPWTKEFWKRVFDFWIDEFHDGYRVDLSKGLTQTYSGSNVGYWSQYDQSRVDIPFDYGNHIWNNHPGSYDFGTPRQQRRGDGTGEWRIHALGQNDVGIHASRDGL